MAGSVNKVILVGNVGKDPEIRDTSEGKKIASFSLATSDTWKDKSGERQEKTEWHRVVIFNQGLAEIAERYVKKGSKLYVSGALQTRKWEDNNGVERYATEVVLSAFNGELTLLDSKDKSGNYPPPANEEDYREGSKSKTTPADYQRAKDGWDAPVSYFNDDIPF